MSLPVTYSILAFLGLIAGASLALWALFGKAVALAYAADLVMRCL